MLACVSVCFNRDLYNWLANVTSTKNTSLKCNHQYQNTLLFVWGLLLCWAVTVSMSLRKFAVFVHVCCSSLYRISLAHCNGKIISPLKSTLLSSKLNFLGGSCWITAETAKVYLVWRSEQTPGPSPHFILPRNPCEAHLPFVTHALTIFERKMSIFTTVWRK